MRTVEIRLQPEGLFALMGAMRMWLDERRFEPSSFTTHDCGAQVLVRIDFKVAGEAEAFARQFGGGGDPAPARFAGETVAGRALRAKPPLHEVVG